MDQPPKALSLASLNVIKSCLTCPARQERLFCNLPEEVVQSLERIKATAFYPRGSFLCQEGQPARGIYILCNGKAKISATSIEGKTIILSMASAGEVLGLSACITNKPYRFNIETLEATQANFIPRAEFLQFLGRFPEVGVRVAQQLSNTCQNAFEDVRSLGLSRTVPERLAKLILSWSESQCFSRVNGNAVLKIGSTQEEIAQMIGTSRETVSRSIGDLKKRGVIRVKGATWTITNRKALEEQAMR